MKRWIISLVFICLLLFGTAMAADWSFPDELQVIEEEAFAGISYMGSVRLPVSLLRIDRHAFAGSTMDCLELPASLEAIDDEALDGAMIGQVYATPGTFSYDWAVAKGYIERIISPSEDFEWEICEDEYVSIKKYIGSDTHIVIPAEIEGYPVREIASKAFKDNTAITTMELLDGVEFIRDRAFYGMKNLTAVVLPDSVAFLGAYAFTNCSSLEFFRYPLGLTEVGFENNSSLNVFQGCSSLIHINVPEGVTRIPDNLFRKAGSLKKVSLPSTLKEVGSKAFQDCTGIESLPIPEGLENVANRAFYGMTKLKTMELPDSVTFIGAYAFYNCLSLETFRYPLGLIEVGFENNSSLTVFNGCSSLKRIDVPEGITRIPNNLFRLAGSLEEVTLPSTLKEIGTNAFRGCISIESLPVPEELERVEDAAFYGMTSLKSIELPDGLTYIGAYAFKDCSSLSYFRYPLGLTTVSFDNNIHMTVFNGCTSLKRIDIPEGVTRIPDNLFRLAESLEEVTLPSTLKEIGNSAFRECTGIETLPVPDGLEQVGNAAFYGMTNLKSMEFPDGLTYIGAYAFKDCSSLSYFRYPLGLTTVHFDNSIHMTVFNGCTSLKRIDIPEGVTQIPDNLFRLAESLEEVTLPSTLKEIGNSAFRECTGIETLPVPDGLEQVGNAAFYGMTNLKSMEFPDGLTYIGAYAFVDCSSLSYFRYPLGLTTVHFDNSIHMTVFKGCESLRRIDVPEGVTKIPDNLFRNAEFLEEVNLPMSLRKVGNSAFMNASLIGEVYLNEFVDEIGKKAFEGTTLTINCEWGTYALRYAQGNNIPYFYLSRTGEYELNGAHWPSGRWYKGDDFIFDGYVRSSVNINNVTGAIYDSAGVQIRDADYDPDDTDHILAGAFTNAMDIAGLELGSYRFVLEASSGGKHEVLVDELFDIVPPPLRVRCENLNIPEGFYAENSHIPVEGTIISNYPIEISFGAYFDNGAPTSQYCHAFPGTFTYELSSAGLDMTALSGGGYQFLVTVIGNGETITAVCSDFTRSGFGLDGTVLNVDVNDVARFVSDTSNRSIFYSLNVDYYSRLMDALSLEDRFKLGMYTFSDQLRGEAIDLLRFALSGDERRSEYLVQVYKKEIASFIRTKGATIDTWSYDKPDHQKLVDKFLSMHKVIADDFVPDIEGVKHSEAVKMAKQSSKSFQALHDLSDIAEDTETLLELAGIFADALEDYSQGLQVLETIAATTISSSDIDYNYQLALREMQKEYTDKCVRCLDNLVQYTMKEVLKEGAKKAVKKIITTVAGGEAYLVYRLSKIAWDVFTDQTDFYSAVGKIVTYKAQIDTFYAANRAYQEAFDTIQAGSGDESTAIRLVNSFQYAKDAAWRSIGTLKSIHYYTGITSDVTLNQIQLKISKLKCP